eukprot:CAMPEP_0194413126 /NCGR_PEP_ID=MMETSP0176-20130528/11645_1 /TAXON_ID=216777 /ORGANISM="Proboscia alata, Strain PI-D3" /LENGTH=161 /DNA_ID=CAMNT_0039216309 /DNA_START=436 /DNA_END=918 /DNA_ORIENTATION=+
MTEERIELLNQIDFQWTICASLKWSCKNANNDPDDANLPDILDRISSPENATQTQPHKRFVVRPTDQEKWDKQYMELVNYVKRFGHARVPWKCSQNPTLSYWVGRQRDKYKLYHDGKPSGMTENRIELLNKIGFEWDKNKSWEKSYEDLVRFVKENGHARV